MSRFVDRPTIVTQRVDRVKRVARPPALMDARVGSMMIRVVCFDLIGLR